MSNLLLFACDYRLSASLTHFSCKIAAAAYTFFVLLFSEVR